MVLGKGPAAFDLLLAGATLPLTFPLYFQHPLYFQPPFVAEICLVPTAVFSSIFTSLVFV